MILKETLRSIVKSQIQEMAVSDTGIEREKLGEIDVSIPFAIIISGIRRCGKSTLLRQVMKKAGRYYYFNFEDPRATMFDIEDFQKLNEVFEEELGKTNIYFFDEIQNISRWELFVRSMLDKKKRFIITGSNASLLSKELGTKLTGRHIRMELFPFSYAEFLVFVKKKPEAETFNEYLGNGGFPEYLSIKRNEILQELLEDIINRDIVVRHKLRSAKALKELGVYLLSNIGKEFSYTSLKKTFGFKSTNSVIDFISYFEDSYLLFSIPKFSYSARAMARNPKKIYSVDNGLSSVNSVSFSEERGRMLENAVFIHLRRKNKNIFYFKEKGECDFLIKEKERITNAVQVCYEVNEDNKKREIGGLLEAMEEFNLKKGLILTCNQKDMIEVGGKRIIIEPAWKWMTSDANSL